LLQVSGGAAPQQELKANGTRLSAFPFLERRVVLLGLPIPSCPHPLGHLHPRRWCVAPLASDRQYTALNDEAVAEPAFEHRFEQQGALVASLSSMRLCVCCGCRLELSSTALASAPLSGLRWLDVGGCGSAPSGALVESEEEQ
jgi:hypothetical protein